MFELQQRQVRSQKPGYTVIYRRKRAHCDLCKQYIKDKGDRIHQRIFIPANSILDRILCSNCWTKWVTENGT